jgi:hypothetical protein
VENPTQSSTERVQGPPLGAVVAVEQPEGRVEEPPVETRDSSEPGIVDITRILGTPTVIVVRSTL